MYSGYFCRKCKNIPLIKISFDDNKKMRLLTKCKCNIKQLTLEEINKLYYSKNINHKLIINNKKTIEKDNSLLLKEKEIIYIIKEKNDLLSKLKKEVIDFFNEKLKEVIKLFDDIKTINDNYEQLFYTLLKSYKSLPDNYSNICNLKNNFEFKIISKKNENDNFNKKNPFESDSEEESNEEEREKIDEKEYVKNIKNKINISVDKFKKIINKFTPSDSNLIKSNPFNFGNCYGHIQQILKISNNILFIRKDSLFHLFSIRYSMIFQSLGSKHIQYLIKIDNDKNNILCLFPDKIKIFTLKINIDLDNDEPIIHDKGDYECEYLSSIIEYDNEFLNNSLFIKKYIDYKISGKYNNILCLKKEKGNNNLDIGKFLVSNKSSILLFEYNLNTNYISNIYSYNLKHTLLNYELIKYNKNDALVVGTNLNIFLLNLVKLENVGEFNIKCLKYHEDIDCQINFTQINNDEIIITQNYNIYLCKISNLKLHLKISNNYLISHTFLLNDRSFAVCDTFGITRYSQKTLESYGLIYKNKKEQNSNNTEQLSFIKDSFWIYDNKFLIKLKTNHYECLEINI